MELEAASESTIANEPSISLPFPRAAWGRVIYGLYITVLPSFAFYATSLFKPEWQSGQLSDYVILFLFPEASLLFFFLLAYSVICYLLLLIAPARYSQFFLVRCGIYIGILLALQYSILLALFLVKELSISIFVLLLLWIFPIIYLAIYRWAVARWTTRNANIFLFILVPAALLIALLIFTRENVLLFIMITLTMSAPFWSLLLSLRAALWLFKNYETRLTLPRGLELTAWLAAYAFAWRFDILKMYELYAALPTQPPGNCYIATAAARGHPRFVQSWTVRCADGKSMQVNAQLQRLKCAELALMAVSPGLHKPLRRIYDVVGKYLARWIQNPWLADIAYFLLKPCEWFAGFLLKIMIPEIDSISKKMYL